MTSPTKRKTALNSRSMGISEYGWGANINQHEAYPQLGANNLTAGGTWHPEEYQNLMNEEALSYINTHVDDVFVYDTALNEKAVSAIGKNPQEPDDPNKPGEPTDPDDPNKPDRPKSVTYKSSSTKIATVNKKGIIRAKKPGTAKITVTSADKAKKSRITVKVVKKPR